MNAGVESREAGFFRWHRGTREALLSAHLAEPAWFPIEPRRSRTTRLSDGSKVVVSALAKARFSLEIDPSPEERERLLQAEHEAHREAEALARVKRELANLPESAEEFRDALWARAEHLIYTVRGFCSQGAGGYTLDKGTLSEIDRSMARVLDLIEEAAVEYSAGQRSEIEQRIRRVALPRAASFERFMASVVDTKATA